MSDAAYFMGSQVVPGKGHAQMFYEVRDEVVTRTLTFITGTGEITRVEDPIVKRLIKPEMLCDVPAESFLNLWNQA